VFGGGLVHQSLHRDGNLNQAFLLQDVVRKTQFVLGEQPEKRSRRDGKHKGGEKGVWKQMHKRDKRQHGI